MRMRMRMRMMMMMMMMMMIVKHQFHLALFFEFRLFSCLSTTVKQF